MLGLGLANADWPSEEFWRVNGRFVAFLLLLVFLGSLAGVSEALGSNRRARADALELAIQNPLKALFVGLLDVVGNEQSRVLGVHAFLLRWRVAWDLPPIRRELVEVGDVQLRSMPKPGVRWTKGKGLVGICWDLNQDVNADLVTDWVPYRHLPEQAWNALPEEVRYGLEFKEFQRTARFEAIVATPIQDKAGRFRGCVSVDSTAGLFDALWAGRPRGLMQGAARMISHLARLS